MTNKERYSEWAEATTLPLTMQPWWMDAVCAGKHWDVLLATNSDGQIIGALPYLIQKHLGLSYIAMPEMTMTNGIWLDPAITEDRWQIAEACKQLSEQLQAMRLGYYYQLYPIGSRAAQAMAGLGFRLRKGQTWRIEYPDETEKLISHFSKTRQRLLQRAQTLQTDHHIDGEDFYRFHAQCMREQRKRITYTREFLLVLERKLSRRNQCRFIAIRDGEQRLHAAAFVVWDEHTLYYYITSQNPTFRNSGADITLTLEAIKLARELHLAFEWRDVPFNALQLSREYGATPTTYHSVERCYHPIFKLAVWYHKLRKRWKR